MFLASLKRRTLVITLFVALCAVAVAVAIYFALQSEEDVAKGDYREAAVTTNGLPCAAIGRDILLKKGSAVDAAIAALFCEGVACLQSMGIGGGFLMTIYDRAKRTVVTLNARETAPAAAHEDMFDGNANLAQNSGLAVGVPGELAGYYEAYRRYGSGKVSWKELIEPTIQLCVDGVPVTPYLERIMQANEEQILASETMREILVNQQTGRLLGQGEVIRRPKLAETLQKIADDGPDIFYRGTLGKMFVEDVQNMSGIMTVADLQDYRVRWEEPTRVVLKDNLTMYSSPPPGSGVLLGFMLNILNGNIPADSQVTTFQRIAEAFKYGYGKRTELGDPYFVDISKLVRNLTNPDYAALVRAAIEDDSTYQDPEHYGSALYQPEDHGTAHISVLAPNGDAVSVTSTVNLVLGAMLRSPQTGIILNNEMDDFSAPNITNAYGVPPSPNNFIRPGKRPLSSMCPAIFVDSKDNVRLIVGAAGGTKITTATALVALFNLYLGMEIKEAVDTARLHHQLFPMKLQYEHGFSSAIVRGLEDIGHSTLEFAVGGSAVTAIAVQNNAVYAHSDFRRGGVTAGF